RECGVLLEWITRRGGPLLFGKSAGVAVVAGEVLVRRVDVEEGVALRAEFLQIRPAALREDGVAGVAVAGFDRLFTVGSFVKTVVTTKTAGPVFMADVVRVSAPVFLHLREKVLLI